MQALKSLTSTSASRIGYIDMMKGMTILWIIWIHAGFPTFSPYRNPIFFFLSGIFFKIEDPKTFFYKKFRMIIIPFCFFYFTSIFLVIYQNLWNEFDFHSIEWYRILDIFRIEAGHAYLTMNGPLWFLLTLLIIQIISYFIFRLNRTLILGLTIISLYFFESFYVVPTPFMINKAFAWFGYFASGFLFGKYIISLLKQRKFKIYLLCGGIIFTILFYYLDAEYKINLFGFIKPLRYLSFIIALMSLFSILELIGKFNLLQFYGKNSLIILGSHLWVLVPLDLIANYYLENPYLTINTIIMALIVAAVLVPIINLMNKKIPFLVGKNIKISISQSVLESQTNNLKLS